MLAIPVTVEPARLLLDQQMRERLRGFAQAHVIGQEPAQPVAAQMLQPIFLDIGLPQLNGYAVAQAIRREPWGERILLIALTGWGHEDDKRRALAAGFNFHLTKPIDPDRIDAIMAGEPASVPKCTHQPGDVVGRF